MSVTSLAAGALAWLKIAYEQRQVIGPQLKRIGQWFSGKGKPSDSPGILIIGAGGCGKSTLGLLLSEKNTYLEKTASSYKESLFTEPLTLKDDPGVKVIVPPGQDHRRASTWTPLLADVSSGKFRGVVIVNAYGFHSLGDLSFTEHRLYSEAGSKEEFVKAYLAERRQEEVRVLKRLAPHVSTCKEKIWLLSIVNKEDLWVNDRPAVVKQYAEGEYGKTIDEIVSALGPARTRHETILMSLVIGSLTTGRGETLAHSVPGYDSHQQFKSIQAAIATMEGLMKWETS